MREPPIEYAAPAHPPRRPPLGLDGEVIADLNFSLVDRRKALMDSQRTLQSPQIVKPAYRSHA
jgi:hypothetical protein